MKQKIIIHRPTLTLAEQQVKEAFQKAIIQMNMHGFAKFDWTDKNLTLNVLNEIRTVGNIYYKSFKGELYIANKNKVEIT